MSSSRSNRLSRLLPFSSTTNNNNQSPSIYETIQQHDETSDSSDVEERAAMAVDEENLRHPFSDHELDEALDHGGSDTQSMQSSPFVRHFRNGQGKSSGDRTRQQWSEPAAGEPALGDDEHDDVPPSFLLQRHGDHKSPERRPAPTPTAPLNRGDSNIPAAGPSTPRLRDQWDTARSRQPLHAQRPQQQQQQHQRRDQQQQRPGGKKWKMGQYAASEKERALWRWANVENLDNFLKDVYVYFLENGIWCIVLSRALNLL